MGRTTQSGGFSTLRGIYCQVLVCLLESLERSDWDSVQLEGECTVGKLLAVDILWKKSHSSGLYQIAAEVKSSTKSFSEEFVKKAAAHLETERKASEYRLYLVGKVSRNYALPENIGKVALIAHYQLDIEALLARARDLLLEFAFAKSLGTISTLGVLSLADELVSRFAVMGIKSRSWTRSSFEDFVLARLKPLAIVETKSPLAMESEEVKLFENIFGFSAPPSIREIVFLHYLASARLSTVRDLKRARSKLYNDNGRLAVKVTWFERFTVAFTTWMMWILQGNGITAMATFFIYGSTQKVSTQYVLAGLVAYLTFILPAVAIVFSSENERAAIRLQKELLE